MTSEEFAEYPIFSGLTEEEREQVLMQCERRRFSKGEWLIREGAAADVFYLITEGSLEVFKQSGAGTQELLDTISRHAVVGEMVLFTDERTRVASVRALTDGEALCIHVAALLEQISEGTRWAYKLVYQMAKTLAVRLDRMNTLLVDQLQNAIQSEGRYSLAAHGTLDGIWDWDLRTNQIHFSPRWKSILGYSQEDIATHPDEWFNRVHPDDLRWLRDSLTAHIEGSDLHPAQEHNLIPLREETDPSNFRNEHRIRHKDNTFRWVLCRGLALRDETGKGIRMAGFLTDITDRKEKEEQLVHDAFHDPLSGLPNRALFLDRLRQCIRRTKRKKDYHFAVLFLDLDRFKVINDSLGHDIGDRLLFAVARRIEQGLREVDSVARLGGDEFTILLDDIKSPNDTKIVADRLQKELARPLSLEGHQVFTSASVGIAVGSAVYDRPEELLRDADTAMYRAKALGRARYELFDPSMHNQAVARLNIEADLRQAVDKHEFRLHYQPIVDLETGEIDGFEALIRWQHPQSGLVPPLSFIPVAEETGLIVPMGLWVLRESCRQIHAWHERFPRADPLIVSVNLSGKQLADPDLLNHVETALRESGANRSAIKLEITESMLMESTPEAKASLAKLKALGVQLTIDDFGTGYSSLSYLQEFPFNTLKIDRSFVTRMSSWRDSPGIINAIVTLSHNLGLDVIAEGVETNEQLAIVRALGCEYCQGFLFYKPMDADKIDALLRQGGSVYKSGLSSGLKGFG